MSDRLPTTPSTPAEPAEPPSPPPPSTALDRAFLTDVERLTTIILVRHGEQAMPERGPAATREEWIDPPLSARGERQAEAVGVGLDAEPIEVVNASPLKRAADTARAIAQRHGLEVHTRAELREIELFRDLPDGRSVPDVLDALLLSGVRERFARERRWGRLSLWRDRRRAPSSRGDGDRGDHRDARRLHDRCACHGGVINSYVGSVLGITHEDMWFRPNHALVHRLVAHGDRRVVRSLNEIHHLQSVDPKLVSW